MSTDIALLQKDITDAVNSRVDSLVNEGLTLPRNYNHSNALKSAFFAIKETKDKSKRPAFEVCTPDSMANALLDMVIQGLSPAKNQCYFVVYGNELALQRSYFGSQAVLKRLGSVKDIWANVIFEGDNFEIENKDGRDRLLHHETSWKNRDNPIEGAYAIIKQEDDDEILTIMTMKEIQTAWNQSKTSQGVHKSFPQEMAKKTVINRAAKNYINTSDDSDLLVDSINRTTENEYDNGGERRDVTPQSDTTQNLLNDFKATAESEVEEQEPEVKEPTDVTPEPLAGSNTAQEQLEPTEPSNEQEHLNEFFENYEEVGLFENHDKSKLG